VYDGVGFSCFCCFDGSSVEVTIFVVGKEVLCLEIYEEVELGFSYFEIISPTDKS
jgi:hypothetical protein